MGWADLPLDITEKIIGHAVKGEKMKKKNSTQGSNWFANPIWKEAIRFSRTIFRPLPSDDVFIGTRSDGTIVVPGPFIENGYLQAVKGLCLGLGHNTNFQPVYDSIYERNTVLSCTLIQQPGYWNNVARNSFGAEETKRQIIDIFTRFKKMNQLTIEVHVDSQDQAIWLWELMRVAVHTNTRPKIINFKAGFT